MFTELYESLYYPHISRVFMILYNEQHDVRTLLFHFVFRILLMFKISTICFLFYISTIIRAPNFALIQNLKIIAIMLTVRISTFPQLQMQLSTIANEYPAHIFSLARYIFG